MGRFIVTAFILGFTIGWMVGMSGIEVHHGVNTPGISG